jgi:hypothetical protein
MSSNGKPVRFQPNLNGLIGAINAAAEAVMLGHSNVHGYRVAQGLAVRGQRLEAEVGDLITINQTNGALPTEGTCRKLICESIALEKEIIVDIESFITFQVMNPEGSTVACRLAFLERNAPKKFATVGATLKLMVDGTRELMELDSSSVDDIVEAFDRARVAVDTALTEATDEIEENRKIALDKKRQNEVAELVKQNARKVKRLGDAKAKLSSAFA